MAKKAGRPGRPPKLDETMVQITLRIPKEAIAIADGMAADRLDRPDRSTILREAIAIGLQVMQTRDR